MHIGDRIRNRRKELGMTLEEVAANIGTSKQTVQRYESGVIQNIPSDNIEKLALVLQTTPAAIMGWDEKKALASLGEELSPLKRELLEDIKGWSDEDALRFLEMLRSFRRGKNEK